MLTSPATLLPVDRAILQINTLNTLVVATRRLAARSHARVQDSRRLIGRRRMLCGGSPDVRDVVRTRLAQGALGDLQGVAAIGFGTGQWCLVCDVPIMTPDLEYRLVGRQGRSTHAACYQAWLEVLGGRRRNGPELPSPAALVPRSPQRAEKVHGKLATGVLWSVAPRRAWYRDGTGRSCHGCEEVIGPRDLQVDLEIGTIRILRLHHECYLCWREELARHHGGSA